MTRTMGDAALLRYSRHILLDENRPDANHRYDGHGGA